MAFAVTGADFYLLPLVLYLVDLVHSRRAYRAKKQVDIDERHPEPGIVEKILSTLILFGGLGALIYGASDYDPSKDVWWIPGAFIWVGSILFLLVGGCIVRGVAGIPLRFGYGGWYIPGRRQKRRY
jgi:hypothetical protein